jgi:hypothetical protein
VSLLIVQLALLPALLAATSADDLEPRLETRPLAGAAPD